MSIFVEIKRKTGQCRENNRKNYKLAQLYNFLTQGEISHILSAGVIPEQSAVEYCI